MWTSKAPKGAFSFVREQAHGSETLVSREKQAFACTLPSLDGGGRCRYSDFAKAVYEITLGIRHEK